MEDHLIMQMADDDIISLQVDLHADNRSKEMIKKNVSTRFCLQYRHGLKERERESESFCCITVDGHH